MRTKLTALAFASLLPFAVVQAADNSMQQPNQGKPGHWIEELKLNESQQQQFRSKQESFRADMQKQREQYRQKQEKQHKAWMDKRDTQRNKHHVELRKLLTSEQQAVFDRHQEQMKSKRAQHTEKRQHMRDKQNMQGMKKGMRHHKHFVQGHHQSGKPMSKPHMHKGGKHSAGMKTGDSSFHNGKQRMQQQQPNKPHNMGSRNTQ